MKSLYNIYEASILGDMEDAMDNFDAELMHRQGFLKWIDENTLIDVKVADMYATVNSDNNIDYMERRWGIPIKQHTELFPENIKLGCVDSITIEDNQNFFDKCKHQLPTFAVELCLRNIDIKDFEIEVEYADLYKVNSIKGLTINVPEKRSGLRLNTFELKLPGNSFSELKEIKINGVINVIVNLIDTQVSDDICKAIKKEVTKFKTTVKKANKTYTDTQIDDVIMDTLAKHIDMNHIDKHWKGVRRIIFKDKSQSLINGTLSHHYMKPGDLIIEKVDGGRGAWRPFQRMFK